MAPRRRKGNTRMDAALDAMKPYGFDLKLARKTVSELLKVYGGDQGWIFIEEGSYKLLVETILENQKPKPEDEEKVIF
ncbi:hypothetical protein L6164_001342 [Bauhinia variegata]|uniref:Uncharacterized protein n=1 Tax=Bauhinia variegata TaxID=167791 RepID=A0ACB9QC19_BAUVA|nr:hypothetical protein L6164_001342 [Bauhinia variegata]